MSRKRAQPTMSRAAQRRAAAAASRAPLEARSATWRARGRSVATIIVVVLAAAAAAGSIALLTRGGGGPPVGISPSATRPASIGTPSIGPSVVAGGGPLAEKLVAVLHGDPFRAHVDESTVARSTAGAVTVTLTAKAAGDVSGRDVALHVQATGAGPAVDQEVVSIGDTTWIRRTGATRWDVHRRTEAAPSIDGLLSTIRLIDDPAELADVGIDTVDGRALHHLTAAGSIAYRSADGAEGAYDGLDVWTTDAGIPVLVKGSFSASEGRNAIVGNVTIRYSDIGGAVTISPPSGAPTPIP